MRQITWNEYQEIEREIYFFLIEQLIRHGLNLLYRGKSCDSMYDESDRNENENFLFQ